MDLKTLLQNALEEEKTYSIDGLKAVGDAAIGLYDGFELIYLDDRKIDSSDLLDLVAIGPSLVSKISKAVSLARQLDKELTDLDESEKAELGQLFASRVTSPGFQKIFNGILQIVDGISEAVEEGKAV